MGNTNKVLHYQYRHPVHYRVVLHYSKVKHYCNAMPNNILLILVLIILITVLILIILILMQHITANITVPILESPLRCSGSFYWWRRICPWSLLWCWMCSHLTGLCSLSVPWALPTHWNPGATLYWCSWQGLRLQEHLFQGGQRWARSLLGGIRLQEHYWNGTMEHREEREVSMVRFEKMYGENKGWFLEGPGHDWP